MKTALKPLTREQANDMPHDVRMKALGYTVRARMQACELLVSTDLSKRAEGMELNTRAMRDAAALRY